MTCQKRNGGVLIAQSSTETLMGWERVGSIWSVNKERPLLGLQPKRTGLQPPCELGLPKSKKAPQIVGFQQDIDVRSVNRCLTIRPATHKAADVSMALDRVLWRWSLVWISLLPEIGGNGNPYCCLIYFPNAPCKQTLLILHNMTTLHSPPIPNVG